MEAGGYRCDVVDEDMELVVRLHRLNRLAGLPYRIALVPDPILWTEVPESLRALARQRVRWQRGLSESLSLNVRLLFHPRGGAAGWAAFPFNALFEWLGPLLEVSRLRPDHGCMAVRASVRARRRGAPSVMIASSIAKLLAEKMCARIDLRSEQGQGSIFPNRFAAFSEPAMSRQRSVR